MIGNSFASRLTIALPRRGLVTAVVYGLSLAVRFTSAAGEEVEIPSPSAQRAFLQMPIMSVDASRLPYQDWDRRSAPSIVFRQDRLRGSPPGCIAP